MLLKSSNIFVSCILIPIILLSQTTNGSHFTISGKSRYYDNKRLWIYLPVQPIADYYNLTLDSDNVTVRDGLFEFRGSVEYPAPLMVSYFYEKERRLIRSELMFVEKGEEKINVGDLEKNKSLGALLQSTSNLEYTRLKDRFSQKPLATRKEMIAMLYDYISNCPSSYVALWLLTLNYTEYGYMPEFAPVIENFDSQIKATKTYQSLAANLRIDSSLAIGNPFNFSALSFGTAMYDTVVHCDFSLIDFWSSYCTPCIRQFPDLNAIYDQFHSRGFTMYGVCVNNAGDSIEMQRHVERYKVRWWNVLDDGGYQASKLNISGIPRNFLLDCAGTIVARDLSGHDLKLFLLDNLPSASN
jgi:thiol-disulfide isomerase/thioredoxin